jgi:HK97 family phage prohead protease
MTAPTELTARRQKMWHFSDTHIELRAEQDNLPSGIAGRVMGVALTYDVVDSYQTMFQRGAAQQSINTKVKARKVPLLMDHDRTVASHVGVVASMTEVGDTLVMTAELFDTPDGRAALEYVKAVIAAGASTGFSIGFVPRRSEMVAVNGKPVELFTEIELREVSITPMPAVPGADITAARTDENAPDTVAPSDTEYATEPDEEVRDDARLLVVAARAALDALDATVRSELLRAYAVDSVGTPTGTDASAGRSVPPQTGTAPAATVKAVTLDATPSVSRSTPHDSVPMTVRADAVRASYVVPTPIQ